jgi:hypothetical protein
MHCTCFFLQQLSTSLQFCYRQLPWSYDGTFLKARSGASERASLSLFESNFKLQPLRKERITVLFTLGYWAGTNQQVFHFIHGSHSLLLATLLQQTRTDPRTLPWTHGLYRLNVHSHRLSVSWKTRHQLCHWGCFHRAQFVWASPKGWGCVAAFQVERITFCNGAWPSVSWKRRQWQIENLKLR